MRISTSSFQAISINAILDQQTALSKTQNQLATGKRILVPSDDPVASSQIIGLNQTQATLNQYQTNATAAQNRLTGEEGTLQTVTNILQRVRELAVAGNNATQTNETRQYMATEIRQQMQELLGLANSKDGNGDYLFSGTMNATQPFSFQSGVGYVYNGNQAQRFVQIGAGRTIADGDPGSTVFQLIRNGNGTFVVQHNGGNTGTGVADQGSVSGSFTPSLPNGYTINFIQALPTDPITYEVVDSGGTVISGPTNYVEGQPIQFAGAVVHITGTPADGDSFTVQSSQYQSMFSTLDNLATALETAVSTPDQMAALNNAVGRSLSDIDQAITSVLTTRATVGARLNGIDDQNTINADQVTQTQLTLSSIQDLDYASAISKLNIQSAGLSAAQQTYVKIQGLSLFNYL